MVRVHQLRDLVHDHLGPRGDIHHLRPAWANGGPIVISIGWPVICALVLLVAFSMAELTSAYPTAGGPYWWAAKLGGKGWSWMTGWFNIVGLVGIVASVGYGAATFLNTTLGVYGVDIFGINFGDTENFLAETWLLFVLILVFYTLVNIFGDRSWPRSTTSPWVGTFWASR